MRLNFIGDFMVGGIFSERFEDLKRAAVPPKLIGSLNDYVTFANLEAPASNNGAHTPGKISVYTQSEPLEILKTCGVKVVSLANNHMMDYGYLAAKETMDRLGELGIRHAGCGENLEAARRPVLLDVLGKKVSFHAYSWTKEFLQPTVEATITEPGVAPINMEYILEDVSQAKNDGVDCIIVSLHWGEGMIQYPRPSQLKFARKLAESGVSVVFGHHPHCIQGTEIYKGVPIVYSAGNFISSPYRISPEKRLVYGGESKIRKRYGRERRVGHFLIDCNSPSISMSAYEQDESVPVLREASTWSRFKIFYDYKMSSFFLSYNYFGLFGVLRRVNEITRLYDEISTRGPIWKRLLKFSAIPKILGRVMKGEEYH